MKNYAIVGFIYTQSCPLSCNFCCHTKDIVGPGKFTTDNIVPIIKGFSKESSVTRFAFSGGDPFLYIKDITSAMTEARRLGVTQPFHLVTSGYWANDEKHVENQLRALAEIGMDALDVSFDVEHARFVSRENIYRIGECCEKLKIRLEIFGNFWNEGERVESLLPNIRGAEKLYSGLVMPIGAARPHFSGRRYSQPDAAKYSCGKPRIYDVAIYPDGSVYPCCSGGFNKEADLICGNVFVDSPTAILSSVYENFHARIAKEIGFDKLYRKIKEQDANLYSTLPSFSSVNSVCEICRDIHSNKELMSQLSLIYEELETDFVLRALESDWKRIHPST